MFNGKSCAQLDIIDVLNRKLLCAQLDIIGVLNRKLGGQREVMCSTGHYWSAQWEFECSTGSYVLNGNLGAQREVMCSMGNYNVLNWTLLLGCSTGSYVLNRKL